MMLFSFQQCKKMIRMRFFPSVAFLMLLGSFLLAGCADKQDPVISAAKSVYRILVAAPLTIAIPDTAKEQLKRDGKIVYADSGKTFFIFIHNEVIYLQAAGGSSYLVSNQGHLVTNDHVVRDSRYPENSKLFVITAISPKPNLLPLSVLWTDATKDLAVVKVEDPSSLQSKPLVFSESKYGALKQAVSAIGFPGASDDLTFGGGFLDEAGYLLPKIHNGSISATYKNTSNVNVWEHSAALSPGDSGGPLVNECGQVMGTNNSGHANWQSIRHAIVSDELFPELERLNIPFTQTSGACTRSSEKAIQWMQWTIFVFVFAFGAFVLYFLCFKKQVQKGKVFILNSRALQKFLNVPADPAPNEWTWDSTNKRWYRYHPINGFEYRTEGDLPPKDAPDVADDQAVQVSPVILKSKTGFPDILLGSIGAVIVGSANSNADIQLSGPYISAQHLKLSYDGKNVRAEDLNSTNGTFVNGKKIDRPVILHPGDVVQLTPQKDAAVYVMQPFDSSNQKALENDTVASLVSLFSNMSPIPVSPSSEIVIGRSGDADIVIEDVLVSRRHCILICDQTGSVFIKDLASSNGTFTENGDVITTPFNLMIGQRFYLGNKKYMFQLVSVQDG